MSTARWQHLDRTKPPDRERAEGDAASGSRGRPRPTPAASSSGAPPVAEPAGELSGAAAWLRGQQSLRDGDPAAAARHFMEASALFTASSPESVLGERIAACYIGQAVSDLVAGRLDAAQQGFSGLRGRASVPDAALRFARQLYELVDAARELPPGERETALAPLAALVLQARLQVRFYDGVHPVVMDWGLWPEE